ncbi:MAG: IPT/TIG domain-containing protein [Vicinamibacterales bacterium]
MISLPSQAAGSLLLRLRLAGRRARLLAVALIAAFISVDAAAQETRYIYDPVGRLIGVVDPQGQVTVYEYDAVGNILAIRRPGTSGTVAITFVNPGVGLAGTIVDIFGAGFSAVSGQNQVAFNGVLATVIGATPTQLTVAVPAGTTSGPIAVTTPAGSASWPGPFRIPSILLSPSQATVGFGRSRQFTATVAEAGDQRVAWSVNGIDGGDPAVGLITSSGLYTAPPDLPNLPTVQVTARSVSFPALSASADVAIVPPSTSVVAAPVDIRIVRPGTGAPGTPPVNVTSASPSWLVAVRPGTDDLAGLPFNVTLARPPSVTAVRSGIGDATGQFRNVVFGLPPAITVTRPGLSDLTGLIFGVTTAAPSSITVSRPGVGGGVDAAPNVTVGKPSDLRVRRP